MSFETLGFLESFSSLKSICICFLRTKWLKKTKCFKTHGTSSEDLHYAAIWVIITEHKVERSNLLIWVITWERHFDEQFIFAPISLKLGSAYVSEDSKKKEKKSQKKLLGICFLEKFILKIAMTVWIVTTRHISSFLWVKVIIEIKISINRKLFIFFKYLLP